jgi:hypothetical protein
MATLDRMTHVRAVALMQDTSDADFSSHKAMRGRDVIGDGNGLGLVLHTQLAVDVSQPRKPVPLGVLSQRCLPNRPDEDSVAKRTRTARKKGQLTRQERIAWRADPDNQGRRWAQMIEESGQLRRELPAPQGEALSSVRVVHVGDAEMDVWDPMTAARQNGDGFIMHAAHDRALHPRGERGTLRQALAGRPVLGLRTVHLGARDGKKARDAVVELRSHSVLLAPPEDLPGAEPEQVQVVHAFEPNPPDDSEPVDWLLLTSEPVETLEQVEWVLEVYEARWLIEDFHMGLKTGCALEKRQLETAAAMKNLLSILSVIAWQLLALRAAARATEPVAASTVLTAEQQEVLFLLRPKLRREPDLTAQRALVEIAKLGGYLARRSDGPPGWRTLWRGMEKVLIGQEVLVAQQLRADELAENPLKTSPEKSG